MNQTIEAIKVHHRSCNKWFILNALHHISASTTTGHNPAGSRFPQEVNPCWIVARIQIYKAHLQQCNVSKYYTIKPLAPPLNKLLRQRRHLILDLSEEKVTQAISQRTDMIVVTIKKTCWHQITPSLVAVAQ